MGVLLKCKFCLSESDVESKIALLTSFLRLLLLLLLLLLLGHGPALSSNNLSSVQTGTWQMLLIF
jgi:hypothetical protein